MPSTAKYKCLLPTNGYVAGDVVEMTAEEFAGVNANEPEPRFAPIEAEAIVAEEETPEEGEEAEVGSVEAEISTENAPETTPEETPEATTEETVTTDATPEGEAVVENTGSEEATTEEGA